MTDFIDFLGTMPDVWRTAPLVLGLLLFWILEGAVPRFAPRGGRWRHAGFNLLFHAMVVVVGLGLSFLLIRACDFTTAQRFGVLYLLELPLWLHVLLALMLLDLVGAYTIHWIQHRVGWMWKFHLVHHTDTQVDVTTSLRHHPGETAFRITFTALGVLIAGVPAGVLVLYQSLSLLFSQLTHANLKLPGPADRLVSWIFVSPDMHKVHHHYRQPFTDTNFGNVFSIWDRLFGTFAPSADCADLKYGLDSHMGPEQSENVGNLLATPFRR